MGNRQPVVVAETNADGHADSNGKPATMNNHTTTNNNNNNNHISVKDKAEKTGKKEKKPKKPKKGKKGKPPSQENGEVVSDSKVKTTDSKTDNHIPNSQKTNDVKTNGIKKIPKGDEIQVSNPKVDEIPEPKTVEKKEEPVVVTETTSKPEPHIVELKSHSTPKEDEKKTDGARPNMVFVNDDHLFPDALTPSKVDHCMLGTDYDVPYMDDEAFYDDIYYVGDNDILLLLDKPTILATVEDCRLGSELGDDEVKKTAISSRNAGPRRSGLRRLCGCVGRQR